MKRDIYNLEKALKVRRVFYIVQKFHELWSTNGLKRDQTFFTRRRYFVPPQSIAHPLCGITVAATATLDETALDLSAAEIRSPQNVKLQMLSRRAALSGNVWL